MALIQRYPHITIFLIAIVSVVLSSYPIIFSGKSYVSPASVSAAVYGWWPPVPGVQTLARFNQNGSDTGATMWQMVPWSKIQSNSILDHGELPLWNRYLHAGDTLIGQGISQLGDPLHWIVIFSRGSALAWDVKYLIAKLLFCFGFGLLGRYLVGGIGLPALFAVMAAYSSVFYFTFSHPSFFTYAYTPWIALSALRMLKLKENYASWGGIWLISNFACFNAGMLSVSVVLMFGINASVLSFSLIESKKRLFVLARISWFSIILICITSPFWITFLDALKESFTTHENVSVDQVSLSRIAGLFDDTYYRVTSGGSGEAPAAGTGMLIFVGFIAGLTLFRDFKKNTFYIVNLVSAFVWGGFVFGWIPKEVIGVIPFINRIGHIHTDFSYLLIFNITILSIYGFRSVCALRNFLLKLKVVIIVALGLASLPLLTGANVQGVVFPSAYLLIVSLASLAFVFTLQCVAGAKFRKVILLYLGATCLLFLANFKYGLYTFGESLALTNPGPRLQLDAPSLTLSSLNKSDRSPFRVTGLHGVLTGNYPALYGIEDIRPCAPLLNRSVVELMRASPGVEVVAWGWMIGYPDPIRAKPLFNLLNVRYLLAHPSLTIGQNTGYLEDSREDLLVIRNDEAWPRAFFTDQVIKIDDKEQFMETLVKSSVKPFAAFLPDQLVAEPNLEAHVSGRQSTVVDAENYKLGPNSTSFRIKTPSSGVVVLTEAPATDFLVYINGKKAKLLTANLAFKAIYIDSPGSWNIEFRFQPAYWPLAKLLFATGISMYFMTLIATTRTQSRF